MAIRIFQHYWQLPLALLAIVEATTFFFAPYGAALLQGDASLAGGEGYSALSYRSLVFAAVLFVSMTAMGLYNSRQRSRLAGLLTRVAASVLGGAMFIVILVYLVPSLHVDRGTLLLASALAFAGAALIRIVFDKLVDEEIFKRRVLVYGAGKRALSIARLRRRSDRRGFVIVGYVRAEGDETADANDTAERLVSPADLWQFCLDKSVDEIVVAMDDRRRSFPMVQLLECRLEGIEITDLVSFLERETGKVRLDVLNPSWMIFSEGFRQGRIHSTLERAFDIVASVMLLLVALPVMLLTALAIKISEGPRASILYRQVRVGLYGRPFKLMKFRSMREDAERDGKPQWAQKNDSRVTRVGSFIRMTRIDELPQILNVLCGEMSFVGPRPERPEFVAELNDKIPYYRERHSIKPGITGWAQLCYPYGSSTQDAAEKLQYDLFYVKNHSLLFYLAILVQTVEVIVWGKGARFNSMSTVGFIGYAAAGCSFIFLSALLWVSWRGRKMATGLVIASALTSLWAFVLAGESRSGRMPLALLYLAEIARDASWLFVLTELARAVAPRLLIVGTHLLCFALLALGLLIPLLPNLGFEIGSPTLLLSRSGLALALCGLLLLEQIYRNSNQIGRGALKYFALAVGGMQMYDLFMYSQAELMQAISADAWAARGAVVTLAVPLLAVAIRRNPQWSLDIFVSRQVVFYTTTLVAVGVYLMAMAVAGYVIRDLGGSWGRVGQILFFAGATVVLAFLLSSGALRREITVFISKHFYRNKYDYRIEWLRFIKTLSSSAEDDVRQTSIRAVTQIIDSPGGILFVEDPQRRQLVPISAWPMRLENIEGVESIDAQSGFVQFIRNKQWIIDLREYHQTPDMYQNIELPAWLLQNPSLRVVSPLLKLEQLFGLFVLYDPPSRFRLTYEDRDLLKTVGRHVATQLAQHDADRRLAESRQFEAYNRLTAFMMHDLKNSVAQLQLIVANAGRHKQNPEFIDDAIDTIGNAVERITRLIEQLASSRNTPTVQSVVLDDLIRKTVERCSLREPVPELQMIGCRGLQVMADPQRLAAVLEHVIRNAQDAAPAGSVRVTLECAAGEAKLVVTDTGKGMDPEFVRERLFQPFYSTKGSKGMGIGAYQTREYVVMLGGRVEVQSSAGQGTSFSINLPAQSVLLDQQAIAVE